MQGLFATTKLLGGGAGVPPVVTSLLCACDSDLHYLISKLEHDSALATIDWFECNYVKLNQDKCHLLISRHKFESVWANIGPCKTWESNDQKLLRVIYFKAVPKCKQKTKCTNQNLQIHES